GLRVNLFGEADQPVQSWDGRGSQRWMHYDNQLRLTALFEQALEGEAVCAERLTYAANAPAFADHNQCGQLISHADLAGVLLFNDYGLTGTLLEQERHLGDIAQSFSTHSRFNPPGDLLSRTDAQGNEQRFSQTVDGQLRAVDLRLSHTTQHLPMVSAITYNAHGQVEREIAGNGVITTLEYAAEDGRLQRLLSRLGQNEPLQDLRYSYDPVGNVRSIKDAALPIRYFANQRIEPVSDYWYDTLDRLIAATGWEAGAVKNGPSSAMTADPAMPGNYRQSYRYDAGNNLLELIHTGPQNPGHRLVADAHSNRCLPVRDGIEPTEQDFRDSFDANGNLLTLQPGQTLRWDARNQLCEVRPVVRDAENDSEHYVYATDGLRVRKVRSLQTNAQTNIIETLYLPGLEIRTHSGTGEVLHVINVATGRGSVRVLHWEAERPTEISNDQQRYCLTDHLGSSTLELDQHAHLITQERFYPFGGTSWWNGTTVQVSYKTVRYSGKEQDATGLYYYGLRYYIPWLQRWINPDPLGDVDGSNLFCFVANCPLNFVDLQGGVKVPVGAIFSKDVQSLVDGGKYIGAQSLARAKSVSDVLVVNKLVSSFIPEVDMLSMTVFQNRHDNTIYRASSAVEGVGFFVKKMQSPEGPQREELAYTVSEMLNFHLVPPTKAKAKSMVQQEVIVAGADTKERRILPEAAKLFYFLINEFDDNSGNQLWDALGNVYLIDHESAFSENKNSIYNLSAVDLSKAFNAERWDKFKSIGNAEWKSIISEKYSTLSKGEVKAFVGRITDTKVAVQREIDRGAVSFGQKRSFLQRTLGRAVS
ncbi:RHS repeat-associated core domain-containing protein, partial [Pseudomonas sp. FW300-N2A2]|uniref:RHS repeat domain-containing protein n=1 Tax=Pseudomonas sp. FW300-N2A2 TaxID=2751316 RepID=UPI0028700E2C